MGNPGEWATTGDYPAVAQKNNEQGVTAFAVDIDKTGAVTDCTVVGASGSAALDEATCRLITTRARFKPATDDRGRATAGKYRNKIRWVLPRPVPPTTLMSKPRFFDPNAL